MTADPADRDTLDAQLLPEALPHLARFLATYLHEDLGPVHGSAAGAAYEFAREHEWEELEALAHEWDVLRAAARALGLAAATAALTRRFGSAWAPLSMAELDAVGEELARALEPFGE